MHGGRRLDYRTFLHCVRAAGAGRHVADVRRRTHMASRTVSGVSCRNSASIFFIPLLQLYARSCGKAWSGHRSMIFHRCVCSARWASHQPRGMDVVPQLYRRRKTAHCGYLVADRDGRHHDFRSALRHAAQTGVCHVSPCRALTPRWWMPKAMPWKPIRAVIWLSADRGPACCAACTAIRNASDRHISSVLQACMNPATVHGLMKMATYGSWAALMT